nr:hypothetical protein Iba_chr08cCG12850 [Ipomoea batatas]
MTAKFTICLMLLNHHFKHLKTHKPKAKTKRSRFQKQNTAGWSVVVVAVAVAEAWRGLVGGRWSKSRREGWSPVAEGRAGRWSAGR